MDEFTATAVNTTKCYKTIDVYSKYHRKIQAPVPVESNMFNLSNGNLFSTKKTSPKIGQYMRYSHDKCVNQTEQYKC